jgi:hypothetical protein
MPMLGRSRFGGMCLVSPAVGLFRLPGPGRKKAPACGALVQYAWRKRCPANSTMIMLLEIKATHLATHAALLNPFLSSQNYQ